MKHLIKISILTILLCPYQIFAQSIWADSVLNTLSIEEQIGQLFMLPAYSNKDSEYEKSIEELIEKYHIGGVIFFQGTPIKQADMTNRFQAISPIPLMIGMDAESGVGWRLSSAIEFPNQTLLGAIHDDQLVFKIGKSIGRHCRLLGVHVNFAPVVDVNINPKNPVIGVRSFGEDIYNVSRKSIKYMQGLEYENIMAVAKHFPGHGDTNVDSHLALPLIKHSTQRLDSIELYPFRQVFAAGIPGVLIGHLAVPAYEKKAIPATISKKIVTNLLRDTLNFKGICFTDAMNMQGVTKGHKKGEADLLALLAGNDIILFPQDISASIQAIKSALKDGRISKELIRERCQRVLIAKERYVLPYSSPIDTSTLIKELNAPEDIALKQNVYAEAITLIKNRKLLLPLLDIDTLKIASINFGDRDAIYFEETLNKYTSCDHFHLQKEASQSEIDLLEKKLTAYNCIIIYNSAARNSAARQFGSSTILSDLIKRVEGKHIILCHPATPYGIDRYSYLSIDAILVGYSHDEPAQQFMAQAIFGGIGISGRLPVSINISYPAGTGLSTPKIRLGYRLPEVGGIRSKELQRIDSICYTAIEMQATPGCEVLVAKDGYVIYNKAFGHHSDLKSPANMTGDIYDIASVTKIVATLPAIMMLYDKKMIDLNSPVSKYYKALNKTNKVNITIKEILLHMAGLKPGVSFFQHAIDMQAINGRLFTAKRTSTNTMKLRNDLYINPNFCYRDSTFSFEKKDGYHFVSPHFYMHKHFRDSIKELLISSEVTKTKNYKYSDIGFVFLKEMIEEQTGSPFNVFLRNNLYNSLGTNNTDFNANITLNMDRIIPSCDDKVYRKQILHGYVHDPTAALLGGITGSAGLFSTANDLVKIMTMYLNNGVYGGKRYIDSTTVNYFTTSPLPISKNRRALGFDKPETRSNKNGPVCDQAPACSYGHTGFTGTIVWNDPENMLTYIFLSNRTYPNEFNSTLIKESIRTKIQEVIYNAFH